MESPAEDLSGSEIDRFISQALPNIDFIQKSKLLSNVASLGVETLADLSFLKEEDLSLLQPNKRRKLLTYIHSNLKQANTSEVLSSSDITSVSEERECYSDAADKDYSDLPMVDDLPSAVVVPWDKFSAKLKKKLADNKRPSKSERNDMVRIVSDEVLATYSHPTRSVCLQIAEDMIFKFPVLQVCDLQGKPVADKGALALGLQIERRCANCNRDSASGVASDTAQSLRKRKTTYGCKQWQPTADLSMDIVMKAQNDLIRLYQDKSTDTDEIVQSMDVSYAHLRKVINENKLDICKLKEEWPILFTKLGMMIHYKRLTHVSLDQFQIIFRNQLQRLLQFMQAQQLKNADLHRIILDVNLAKEKVDADTDVDIIGVVIMLCKYFHEDPNKLVLKEDEDVPLNPCIVAHGPDVLTSTKFDIFVDKKCAFDSINSALEAVTLTFACYYVFNVRYPEEISATLELLQRNFANIDPLHGSKSKHPGKKARIKGINGKLLSFYNAINDFEVLV